MCGVVGVYGHPEAANLAYLGLYALQHRGQESAGIASAEAVFVGTHISEFAGIPATGRDVRVPYAVFWELEEGQITSLTLYGPMSGIIQQLTA